MRWYFLCYNSMQTSKIEIFVAIVNRLWPLTIVKKTLHFRCLWVGVLVMALFLHKSF